MTINPNKLVELIHKTLSIKQNAVWEARDFARFLAEAAKCDTYLETMNSETMPNSDTLHYRIHQDVEINALHNAFLSITKKCVRKLRRRKVIVIIDYTHEPFFGRTKNDWVHGYMPASGSRGSYRFLSASIVIDDKRYFVYGKPVNRITDESFELLQILAQIELLELKIEVVLLDRGFARSSENIAVLKDAGVKYLGLYQKYKNIKNIIKGTKRRYINRKFKVKGIPTRLVIGKKEIAWVFVTNMKFSVFEKYLKLYKKRWNIETGFRVHDEACIKTKSTDIRVRYFLFIAAMLLYNVWKYLDAKISFKRFVIQLWSGVDHVCKCRSPT